jgi:hypothetical protein
VKALGTHAFTAGGAYKVTMGAVASKVATADTDD